MWDETLFMRYLNLFPKNTQIFVGTATVTLLSIVAYSFIRPGESKTMRTLSPEWQQATLQYQAAQNQNPIQRYKEAKRADQ